MSEEMSIQGLMAANRTRAHYNSMPFHEFVQEVRGAGLDVGSREEIERWKFTGLSNADFLAYGPVKQ